MTGEVNRPQLTDEERAEAVDYLRMPYSEFVHGLRDLPEEERQRRQQLLGDATSLAIGIMIDNGEVDLGASDGRLLTTEEVYAELGLADEEA